MKIGIMFGNPETTTGGNALKFYASIRMDIRRISSIKQGDQDLGNRVRVKVVKNKLAPPFKIAEFDIMFGEGISRVGSILDVGVDVDVIQKAGSWFSYGEQRLGQGREAVKDLFNEQPDLAIKIEREILSKMKKEGAPLIIGAEEDTQEPVKSTDPIEEVPVEAEVKVEKKK